MKQTAVADETGVRALPCQTVHLNHAGFRTVNQRFINKKCEDKNK